MDTREITETALDPDKPGCTQVKRSEVGAPANKVPKDPVIERVHSMLLLRPVGINDLANDFARQFRGIADSISCGCEVSEHGSRRMSRPSWVYVIHAAGAGAIKIGHTMDAAGESRMRKLQANAPEPLSLVALARGRSDLESRWHRLFRDHRRHSEWFDATPIVPLMVDAMKARHGCCARCGIAALSSATP